MPWGVVLIFFSFVVFLHLVLHEFSPWERDLVKAQLLNGTGLILPGLGNVGVATGADGDVPIPNEPEADAHDDPLGKGNPAMYPEDSSEEYVAICMAVKDQAPDLSEVLLHHYHHLGIRRFYLMDDGSEPPLSTYANWSIPREHITFHYYNRTTDHVPNMQDTVYNECINLYRKKHTWMAFLDADEMLEVTAEETLTELLQRLEKNRSIGALAVSCTYLSFTQHSVLIYPRDDPHIKRPPRTSFLNPQRLHRLHLGWKSHTQWHVQIDRQNRDARRGVRRPRRATPRKHQNSRGRRLRMLRRKKDAHAR
jgi:hypothetical protein